MPERNTPPSGEHQGKTPEAQPQSTKINYGGYDSAKAYSRAAEAEYRKNQGIISERATELKARQEAELAALKAKHEQEQDVFDKQIEEEFGADWDKIDLHLEATLRARDAFRKALRNMSAEASGFLFYEARLLPFIADPNYPVDQAPIRISTPWDEESPALTPEEVRQIATDVAQEAGLTKDKVADILAAKGIKLEDDMIKNDTSVLEV